MDDASSHFRSQLVKDAMAFIEKIDSVVALTTGIIRPDLLKRLSIMQLDLKQIDCSKPEADKVLNNFFDLIKEIEGELDLVSQPS